MRDEGVRACAIEASSIGLAEARMDGMPVRVAVFTNFTRDHLDYHPDMAAYWAAKRALFDWPGLQAAVVNTDDPQGLALARELAPRAGLALWTVGLGAAPLQPLDGGAALCHLGARDVGYADGGLAFTLVDGVRHLALRSTLIGDYNVHNLLGVLGAVAALGLPLADAVAQVPGLSPVPGRMQRVETPAGAPGALPEVVVDYAHTPDALDKALGALRPLAAARGGRLHCVFGCGGNRDATKRPLMAAIAERLADAVVLTSDNPRHEDPLSILAQIRAGLSVPAAVAVEPDRAAAIAAAVAGADARDVILIAGKGHEDYQEIAGQRLPFDDARQALLALQRRAGADR
jgi:UDP-N-acetylmuramoyl-L-alanyl-D-glutamate--2,6-diaminopimelate ligase